VNLCHRTHPVSDADVPTPLLFLPDNHIAVSTIDFQILLTDAFVV
jgi:hypothetical protein